MTAGPQHVIRFRKTDGSSVIHDVTTNAGDQTTLVLTGGIASGQPQPEAGDVFQFGLDGAETVDMKVVKILPGDKFSAAVVLEDAAPAVLVAASPTPTVPAVTFGRGKPSKPRVDNVTARRDAGRTDRGGFIIKLGDPPPTKESTAEKKARKESAKKPKK